MSRNNAIAIVIFRAFSCGPVERSLANAAEKLRTASYETMCLFRSVSPWFTQPPLFLHFLPSPHRPFASPLFHSCFYYFSFPFFRLFFFFFLLKFDSRDERVDFARFRPLKHGSPVSRSILITRQPGPERLKTPSQMYRWLFPVVGEITSRFTVTSWNYGAWIGPSVVAS